MNSKTKKFVDDLPYEFLFLTLKPTIMQTATLKSKDSNFNVFVILFFLLSFLISNAQVGIGTTDPKSTFEVNGSNGQTVTIVTANTTLGLSHSIVVCNNGLTAITITLPNASGIKGRIYTIKKEASSTANVTIAGTINGISNLILKNTGDALTVFSDGIEWKTTTNSLSTWTVSGNSGTAAGTNFIGTTDAQDLVLKTNNVEKLRVLSTGNVGVGVADPTAYLHIKAGSTAAGTAPIKLTDGPLMTLVEPGAIEYKGHTFYASTYLVRRSIMLAQDIVVTPITVANTTTETLIYTAPMAANYLTAGKMINIKLYGRFGTNGAGNLYTIRVKLSGVTVLTVTSTSANSTNRPFDIDLRSTIRSIGASGTIISYGKTQQDNLTPNIEIGTLGTINTTIPNTITVTVQWASASSNNTITLEGGATECVDANN
jgi:hypothetical protein